MFKLVAGAAFFAITTVLVAIPATEVVSASRLVLKTDRPNVRNYLSPRLDGRPVAFCVSGESGCGKEAADAFCRVSGFGDAILFQRDHGASGSANGYFRQIKCRAAAAPAQASRDVVIEPAGAPLITNYATKSDSL